jgi:hypothetical protein
VREILECWFENRAIGQEYLIVDAGKLAGVGAAPAMRPEVPKKLGGLRRAPEIDFRFGPLCGAN